MFRWSISAGLLNIVVLIHELSDRIKWQALYEV